MPQQTGEASYEFELSLSAEVSPRDDSVGDPGSIDDLQIEDLGIIDRVPDLSGKYTWRTRSIFNGVNKDSPDIKKLIENIIALVGEQELVEKIQDQS